MKNGRLGTLFIEAFVGDDWMPASYVVERTQPRWCEDQFRHTLLEPLYAVRYSGAEHPPDSHMDVVPAKEYPDINKNKNRPSASAFSINIFRFYQYVIKLNYILGTVQFVYIFY